MRNFFSRISGKKTHEETQSPSSSFVFTREQMERLTYDADLASMVFRVPPTYPEISKLQEWTRQQISKGNENSVYSIAIDEEKAQKISFVFTRDQAERLTYDVELVSMVFRIQLNSPNQNFIFRIQAFIREGLSKDSKKSTFDLTWERTTDE